MERKDDFPPNDLVQIQDSHQTDEAKVDPRIHQLELAVNELHKLEIDLAIGLAKRSHLIRRVNSYRTALAPCNKVPSELIGEIIMHVPSKLQPIPLADARTDPRLQYTQICSYWRRAAFGVNQLWNNVDVKKCENDSPINLVAAWLRQSSSTQIVLKISGFPVLFDATHLWKELLVPYSHRLKLFDSILRDANHFHSIPFDALTTLSLLYEPWNDDFEGSMMAPSLQHFHITKTHPAYNRRLISLLPGIPWAQLTSVSLDGWFSFHDVRTILLRCPLLEICQLGKIGSCSVGSRNAINLPRLKSLKIILRSDLFYELCSLVVPNLSTLSINLPPGTPAVLQNFSQLMATLKGSLRRLEITKSRRNSPVQKVHSETSCICSHS